ncbi:MAG TPA: response regulator transcription factor [Candidatus Dormibacteraeota bacterium]|nr:response regulator transcription factor [Candidatus Dormibacteraeota bacterium]
MKLLVVEDEAATVTFLQRGLREEGFAVDVARDAASADAAMAAHEYDLVLLDVMLPGCDGFALCKKWRESGHTMPILFLTARDEVRDRVRGLTLGADDYLTKPFAFAELMARIQALLRRGSTPRATLRVGDLVVDAARRQARRGDAEIPLTAREFRLLEYLARNAGRVVSRADLWEHVWESHSEPESNVVDVYVRYLRNKLGRSPDLITTVRGGGYVLEATGAPHQE